jgi:hypothetical protein
MNASTLASFLLVLPVVLGCSSSSGGGPSGSGSSSGGSSGMALDPDTAPLVAVDRFSDAFAHLFARSKNPSLPGPNAPIHFDSGAPFITHGLGPDGGTVTYYNFDVLPTTPAPIYVLFAQGDSSPVAGQLNVIGVIPGDTGYNDFWRVIKVTVPAGYVANTVTSVDQIMSAHYPMETTSMLVNCPVVPDGSSAALRYTPAEPTGVQRGWYKHQVVKYFTFAERTLATTAGGTVPISDIYVTFNINPDPNNPMSGPPSGFETQTGTMQTHNVPETLPGDAAYSPLWKVDVYDHSAFATVMSLATAMQAPLLVSGAALVNCPIVAKQ